MHKIKFLVFAFLVIFIFGTMQSAHAHGLGTVESDIQFFNDNFFKVKVQTTPDVLSGNESEIGLEITTINHDQNSVVSNVEYFVEILDPPIMHVTGSFLFLITRFIAFTSFFSKGPA